MIYKWKPGSHHRVDANDAAREIDRVKANTGFFKPKHLVAASRPEEAVLHPEFEWDDAVAAEEYREEQAKNIIRSVVYIEDKTQDQPEPEMVRAFVSVKTLDGPQYTTIQNAVSDAEMREQIIKQARSDMLAFQRKYMQIMDLADVIYAFEKAADRASKI